MHRGTARPSGDWITKARCRDISFEPAAETGRDGHNAITARKKIRIAIAYL